VAASVLDGAGKATLRSLFKDLKFGTVHPMENEEISFGRFRLDLRAPELRHDGRSVRIHHRALGILSVLAEAKGEIVSKDELMTRLWPGRVVEEGNLHVHVSALRKSLHQHAEGHNFIVTVPGRGYRLTGLSGEDYPADSTVEEFSLGRFRLDLGRRELSRDGQPLRLHRHPLSILCALAEAQGGIVSRDKLMARIWPGRTVDEGNLHVHVSALRKALDEHGGGHSLVVTVLGGYRLANLGSRSVPLAEGSVPPHLSLPDKPSIAVMPFQNFSGNPDEEYFADGMVEEIITALSRIRWLFVIARNSSFTYKGQAVDVKQIGQELGVRYVLEGSVRKVDARVRITAQLIEAENGTHLWADRFDGLLENVLDLQDQVAISVAGVIEPTLQAAEIRRAVDQPSSNPTTYDLYLRALQTTGSWEKKDYLEALDWLSQATKRDANYGPALALSALYHSALSGSGWADDPEATRQTAISLARRAVRNAGDDAATLGRAAYILAYFGEVIDAATALIDRSLQINPSFADGWRWSGWLRLWAGLPDVAIDHFEKSSRLNPRAPLGGTLMATGVAHFFARRLDQARTILSLSLQQHPNWVPTNRFLAACYAHLGQLDEAKITIERLRGLTPVVLPSADNWRDPEQREFYLSGLRLAMSATDEAPSWS
jgi:TolB-like protein/DNA-binding winged helix-turn-helix (wHTH) protein